MTAYEFHAHISKGKFLRAHRKSPNSLCNITKIKGVTNVGRLIHLKKKKKKKKKHSGILLYGVHVIELLVAMVTMVTMVTVCCLGYRPVF